MSASDPAVTDDAAATDQEAHERHTWTRDHPITVALTGFFVGLAYVVVIPAVYVALTRWVLSQETAGEAFPYVLVLMGIPVLTLIPERTRWFGRHMLLGMVVTAVVTVGVGALVLWILMSREG